MADKRVKYIADDGPFCEVGITGRQASWRRNQSGFVTEANAALLIASGKFALSSTAFATDVDGLDSHLAEHAAISAPIVKKFPTWPANTGVLLASLVVSSTASRTAGVVTITATGHGITTGSTYVGYRFYYPGSPTLAAGWYDSILTIPDANTITFSAAGADFGSESINGGAAWVTDTDAATLTIPGNTLLDGSRIKVSLSQIGDTTSVTKRMTVTLGGSTIAYNSVTTTSTGSSSLIARCIGTNKQIGHRTVEGALSNLAINAATRDITTDQVLALKIGLAAAAGFIALIGAFAEITV